MRRLAFTLHINQPPWQREDALREAAVKCYLPLIKLIKEKKYKVTLSVPLSLLELMDKYGYQQWLDDIKELVRAGRVELVGGAAYNALLTEIPSEFSKFAEKQIILNEYALGYYFGKKGGFEGDPSILIRDLKGFFPPNLLVSSNLIDLVNDLGYEWVLVNPISLESGETSIKSGVYKLKGKNVRVVVVNTDLNALVVTKTNAETSSIMEKLMLQDTSVVAVRGEIFGLEDDRGPLLLEHIMGSLKEKHVELVLVSEFVELENESGSIVIDDVIQKNDDKSSDKEGREMLNELFNAYNSIEKPASPVTILGAEDIAVWKDSELQQIEDEKLRDLVKTDLLFNKCLNTEQFANEGGLNLVGDFIDMTQNEDLKSKFDKWLHGNKSPTV